MVNKVKEGTEGVDHYFGAGVLQRIVMQGSDPLLGLIGAYRDDSRPTKIDVGVGVYRDERGATPVLRAVKAAERLLIDSQATKAYLGPEGDAGFFERLIPIIFGAAMFSGRLCGVQTPGGTGALRLAAELISGARPDARLGRYPDMAEPSTDYGCGRDRGCDAPLFGGPVTFPSKVAVREMVERSHFWHT